MLPSRMHGPFFRFLPKAPLFRGRQAGQVWPHCVKRSSLHSIFALQKFHIRSLLFPFPRKPASLGFARSHTCSGQIVPGNLVASRGIPNPYEKAVCWGNISFNLIKISSLQIVLVQINYLFFGEYFCIIILRKVPQGGRHGKHIL